MSVRDGSSRRKRRGAAPPTPELKPRQADAATPRVDPRAYQEIMSQIRAFSEQRFERLITAVAQGFFGLATPEETKLPELRAAFFAFFVLGYRDQNGISIVRMFRGYGFKPTPIQTRALDALESSRLRLVEITERHEGNRQFSGIDLLDRSTLRFVDKNAYEALDVGDAIMAWFMPSGGVFRPVEVATHVDSLRIPGICSALKSLAERARVEPAQIAIRQPAQVFWTVYRGVNVLRGGPAR